MARSKHWKWAMISGPTGLRRAKVLTRAGVRRRKRDHQFVELFVTALRNDETPKDAFQAAARMLGASPKDRRRAWQRIKRAELA